MNISRILYRNESNKHEVEKDNNILLKEEDRPDASSSGDRTYRITEELLHDKMEEFVASRVMSYVQYENVVVLQTEFNLGFEYFLTNELWELDSGFNKLKEFCNIDFNAEVNNEASLKIMDDYIENIILKTIWDSFQEFVFVHFYKLIYANVGYDREKIIEALKNKRYSDIQFNINFIICVPLLMGQKDQLLFYLRNRVSVLFGGIVCIEIILQFTDVTKAFIDWYNYKYKIGLVKSGFEPNSIFDYDHKFPWQDHKWNNHMFLQRNVYNYSDIFRSASPIIKERMLISLENDDLRCQDIYNFVTYESAVFYEEVIALAQTVMDKWDTKKFEFGRWFLHGNASAFNRDHVMPAKIGLFSKLYDLHQLQTLSFTEVTKENRQAILLNLLRVACFKEWCKLMKRFNVLDGIVQSELQFIEARNNEMANSTKAEDKESVVDSIDGQIGLLPSFKSRFTNLISSFRVNIKLEPSLKEKVQSFDFKGENWANIFQKNGYRIVISREEKIKFIEALFECVQTDLIGSSIFDFTCEEQINLNLLSEIIIEHYEPLFKQLLRSNTIEALLPVKIAEENIFGEN